MSSESADPPPFVSLYFGYASNLSPRTMNERCPQSLFVGLARLDDYIWHINSTRYANIRPSPGDTVYGALFFLTAGDEASLNISEGVPWLYEKHTLEVSRFGLDSEGKDVAGQRVRALVYVDVRRQEDGEVVGDYVVYINKAVNDTLPLGLPREYVDRYIRPWVGPEVEDPEITRVRITTPWRPLAARKVVWE